MQRQYKDHLSEFREWTEKKHARRYLIFPDNLGPYLSLDETALSQGELYTIITNKKAKGKKGALVAIIAGTKAEPIVKQLLKIPSSLRNKVKEITLDMAFSMKHIASKCFPKAIQVTDRFHVQKLAIEALQDLRIKHRWDAIDKENEQLQETKQKGNIYRSCSLMATLINNYLPEADICSTKQPPIGQKSNQSVQRSYSKNIPISIRLILW